MKCRGTISLERIAADSGGALRGGGNPVPEISAVVDSGNRASPGSLFVAVKGTGADGHDFIDQAFERGAVAAVVTDEERLGSRPGIVVEDSRRALSRLADLCSGHPSRELLTFGITGTNGKTTVHWLLHHALIALGSPSVRIGSLGIGGPGLEEYSNKVVVPGSGDIILTTPGPLEIHAALRQAVDAGLTSCVLETSSHALDQCRVADVGYDVAVFTNLSPDHLNYHQGMEDYFEVKARLFRQLARLRDTGETSLGIAVINADCPFGRRMGDLARALDLPTVTFGTAPDSSVRIVKFRQAFPAGRLTLEYNEETVDITTSLVGDYNASNIAAAFAALVGAGFDPDQVGEVLSECPGVPGRLEPVDAGDVAVLVDYAHTGEGLHNVLKAVRSFVRRDLWVVFGCGGGKDPGKRRAMGEAAAAHADRIVLTSDNPRNEDPRAIIEDILCSGCRPEFVELDRARAIRRTLDAARPGDVVVLAGKGHEDYQVIGDKTLPFSDREEVLRWSESRRRN